jgi:hypothetical protein
VCRIYQAASQFFYCSRHITGSAFFDVLIGNNQFVVKITKTMLTSPKANLIGDVSLKFVNVVACYLQWRNCSIHSLQTHRTFKFKGCIALHSKFEATKKEREKVFVRLQFSEVWGGSCLRGPRSVETGTRPKHDVEL